MISHLSRSLFGRLLCTAVLAACLPVAGQVTYFDRVPTQDELKRALGIGSATNPASATTRRGVRWDAAASAGSASGASSPAPGTSTGPEASEAPAAPSAQAANVAMNIQFELGSARMTAASQGYVEQIAQLLKKDSQIRLQIQGHTDARGDRSTNVLLSWDRAMTVYRYIVEKHKVDPDRLQPIGRGSAEPLPDRLPLDAVNRRVQFSVIAS